MDRPRERASCSLGGPQARTWPLYVASLHARLRCQTWLVVATSEATARWAATPIATLQLGSPFVPLVLGPGAIPRLSIGRARQEPWLAVLSALVHGNAPGGAGPVRAVAAALAVLPPGPASLCYALVRALLDEAARRVACARCWWISRGPSTCMRARVAACEDLARLEALALGLAAAAAVQAVEGLLAGLPAAPEAG